MAHCLLLAVIKLCHCVINSIPIPAVISHCKSIHLHRCSRTIDHSVLAIPARSANTKPHTSNLTFGLFNICSLTNKGSLLFDLLNDRKFNFFCLTETWQDPNDLHTLFKLFLLDLSAHHNPFPLAEVVAWRYYTIKYGKCPPLQCLYIPHLSPSYSGHYLSTTQAE